MSLRGGKNPASAPRDAHQRAPWGREGGEYERRSGAPGLRASNVSDLKHLAGYSDPCGAARTSRPREAVGPHAAGSTARLPDQKTASGYGHLTRSRPQDSANFLQTHDQGPAGFVALPAIRQSSTWGVAPRGGMVSGGSESHPGNEPGGSICAGPGPLLPVCFAIRLTTASPPRAAQAVGRHKKAPPERRLQRGHRVGYRWLARPGPPASFDP